MTHPLGKVRGMTAPYVPGQQVYLIRWGAYVKIGCSNDPIGRLARVTERGQRPPRQNGDPELVGTIAGGFGAEAWLHAALAGHRAQGEWFHLRGPVADLVEAAADRGVDDLPPRPSRAHRAGVARAAVRPGLVPFIAVAARGPAATAVRHVIMLPGSIPLEDDADLVLRSGALALCGTGVRLVTGEWQPGHVRGCLRCLRAMAR